VIPASLLLSDSAMPDILRAGGLDVKAVVRNRHAYIRREIWLANLKSQNLKF